MRFVPFKPQGCNLTTKDTAGDARVGCLFWQVMVQQIEGKCKTSNIKERTSKGKEQHKQGLQTPGALGLA